MRLHLASRRQSLVSGISYTHSSRAISIQQQQCAIVHRSVSSMMMQLPPPPGGQSQSVECDWTEHAAPGATGRKYYFNKITKQSVWVKPQELLDAEMANTRTKAQESSGGLWKEHTAQNGKKYYYNTVTKQSTWTMPPEFKKEIGRIMESKVELSALEQALRKSKEEIADLENKPVSVGGVVRTQTVDPTADVVAEVKAEAEVKAAATIMTWSNTEESTAAFLQLLNDKTVGATWTWDMTMRQICTDHRYTAFKSTAEKKAVLSDYQAEKSREQREEKRKMDKLRREQFSEMLREKDSQIDGNTKWKAVQELFLFDPRYQAVMEDRMREDLFVDFVREVEKKEKDAKRQERKDAMHHVDGMLVENDQITATTKWSEATDIMKGQERWEVLDRLDQLIVFEAFIKDMEKKEDGEKKAVRAKERRTERCNRDMLKSAFKEQADSGELHARMLWKEWLQQHKELEAYQAVLKQTGSTPRNLFEDVVEKLQSKFEDERKVLRSALKDLDFSVELDTQFEEYLKAVEPVAEVKEKVNPRSLRPLFDDLVMRAKKKKEDSERRARHQKEDYEDLMVSKHFELDTVTWEQANERLQKHSAYKALDDDDERKKLFEEWIEEEKRHNSKKRSRDGETSESEEEGAITASAKKKKKHKKEKKHKKRSRSRS